MSLTQNRDVDHYIDQELRSFPVEEGLHVYKGALVGLSPSTHCARPLIRGDLFLGLAYEEIDNSKGVSESLCVRVYTLGDFRLPLEGATRDWTGCVVYASSDDKLTLIEFGNSYVGTMIECTAFEQIILRLDTFRTHR